MKLINSTVDSEQALLEGIENVTVLSHQRLTLQRQMYSRPFALSGQGDAAESICIVSMHEYSRGAMKDMNQNLTRHKKDFASRHDMTKWASYIEVDARKYRATFVDLASTTWLKLPALRDIIMNDTSKQYGWYMWVDCCRYYIHKPQLRLSASIVNQSPSRAFHNKI